MKVEKNTHAVIDLSDREVELLHDILLNAQERLGMTPECKEANKEHLEFCRILLLNMT